ncbi:MAG: sugar ABC transporter permease [Chloroflexota bacterium]|nr:MAG: sugar ABC transporter permease [Chloroflexota bacterium]
MAQSANQPQESGGVIGALTTGILRIAVAILIPLLAIALLVWSVTFMTDREANKALVAVVAIIVGVGGVWVLYLAFDNLVSLLPERQREGVRPFVFVGPALLILTLYLVYPAVETTYRSFFDARSENFIGLDNYLFVFTDSNMLIALRNNLLWLIFVTSFVIGLGLVVAVLVDRIRGEAAAKSIIFLPMAISAVGASVIWRFIYSFQPANRPQIGLLNAIVVALGGEPQGWLILQPWNNFFLIIIMIWILVGFAMVVLSAAVKGVPGELLEAARIDGASEFQIFFRVIIPYIRGTIITIATTVLIMVLKVFDIVFVMTSGQFNTEVIANRMFAEMFTFRNFGRASAIAVVLLIAVIPVMIYNVRGMRESRS